MASKWPLYAASADANGTCTVTSSLNRETLDQFSEPVHTPLNGLPAHFPDSDIHFSWEKTSQPVSSKPVSGSSSRSRAELRMATPDRCSTACTLRPAPLTSTRTRQPARWSSATLRASISPREPTQPYIMIRIVVWPPSPYPAGARQLTLSRRS